jgi:hypothetical protein
MSACEIRGRIAQDTTRIAQKKAPAKQHAEAQVSIPSYREPGACATAIRATDQSSLIVRSVLVPQCSHT